MRIRGGCFCAFFRSLPFHACSCVVPVVKKLNFLLYELLEAIRTGLRAIASHKMRSALTMVGIVIGITSVTSMVTVINGIEQFFENTLSELGTDVVYVEKWPWTGGPNTKWWEYINRPEIKPELAETISDRARLVAAAAPVVATSRPVTRGSYSIAPVTIEASTTAYERVHVVELASGRFYSELDNRTARRVAVIGANVADTLFPTENPLGKFIRIAGHRFQVIGVMARKGQGSEGPGSVDQRARIPMQTFGNIFGLRYRGISVQARIAPGVDPDAAKDELTGIVRVARAVPAGEDDNFEINDLEELRAQLAPVKRMIYGVGIFLTALALLVGGIGVMNIMFVSVKERTREIGIRKAVGARRRTILIQFLIEAVAICLAGGLVGVGFATLCAQLLSLALNLPTLLPLGTIFLAFAICTLVGLIFGLAPAWAGAKSDPIESLRYE